MLSWLHFDIFNSLFFIIFLVFFIKICISYFDLIFINYDTNIELHEDANITIYESDYDLLKSKILELKSELTTSDKDTLFIKYNEKKITKLNKEDITEITNIIDKIIGKKTDILQMMENYKPKIKDLELTNKEKTKLKDQIKDILKILKVFIKKF
jgi:uncharacterized protein Yka (UPF0111/DUF47 family)